VIRDPRADEVEVLSDSESGSRQHWVGIWANEFTGRKFRSDAQRPAS